MVIKVTLTTLLNIFFTFSLFFLFFHFIFLLIFNLQMNSWINKFKDLILKNRSNLLIYNNSCVIKNCYETQSNENYKIIKLTHKIYTNYVNFHFFKKLYTSDKTNSFPQESIDQLNIITNTFIVDALSLRIFKLLSQFSLIFWIVLSIYFHFC